MRFCVLQVSDTLSSFSCEITTAVSLVSVRILLISMRGSVATLTSSAEFDSVSDRRINVLM